MVRQNLSNFLSLIKNQYLLPMLHEAVSRYHDLLRDDSLAESSRALLDEGLEESKLIFGGRRLSPYLRPHFVTEQDFSRVVRICETVWAAIQKVTEAAYSFVELNGETPAGIAYVDAAYDIFSRLPVMQKFGETYNVRPLYGRRYMLDVLLDSFEEFLGRKPDSVPQIAIVDLKGMPTQKEFELFKEFFEGEGYPSIICSPDELEFDNSRLRVGDFQIDIVYKRLLVNEYLPIMGEYPALLDAYRAGAVCLVNSFRSKLIHKKALFAVLTDERRATLFSSEEQDSIRRHVPWTRLVRAEKTDYLGKEIDLLEYIKANRDKLVLKPNDDYGGHGITIGWNTDEIRWEEALRSALVNGDYLAQERVPTAREMFPAVREDGSINFSEQLVDLDPLLFNGKVRSAFTRLSSTELANVSSGGGMVPTFIIEKKN